MITSLVLSLREGLEAALIIGIVLGALRRTGRSELNRFVWLGTFSAILLSLLAALSLRLIGEELEGRAEEIYEGSTMLLAAGVLTWMIFWMSHQSKNLKAHLESHVSQAASMGGKGGVFFLAFIAVLREGIELALYLVATSLTSSSAQTLVGTFIGLFTAATLGYLLFTATIRMNLQRFFQVTGVILVLFAAGMISHSIAEFNEAGIVPTVINPIWNLSSYLDEGTFIGTILNMLFGYHSSPSLTQALGYGVYILVIALFFLKAKKLSTT